MSLINTLNSVLSMKATHIPMLCSPATMHQIHKLALHQTVVHVLIKLYTGERVTINKSLVSTYFNELKS